MFCSSAFILPFGTIHAIMTYYGGISVIVLYRQYIALMQLREDTSV